MTRRQLDVLFFLKLAFWALIFGYIAWEAWQVFTPPVLRVDPMPSLTTTPHLRISGSVRRAVKLTINEDVVALDGSSSKFSYTAPLVPGINKIIIKAEDRLSKSRIVTKEINYVTK